MKATLEFRLPVDRYDYQTTLHAEQYRGVLTVLLAWLRSEVKYNDTSPPARLEVLEEVRAKLHEFIGEEGLPDEAL